MALLHSSSPKGAELIAAKRADNRKVTQVAFKPDWNKHTKAAPFKRYDVTLYIMPIGIIRFPGAGHSGQSSRKAPEAWYPGHEVPERRLKRRREALASVLISIPLPSDVGTRAQTQRHPRFHAA